MSAVGPVAFASAVFILLLKFGQELIDFGEIALFYFSFTERQDCAECLCLVIVLHTRLRMRFSAYLLTVTVTDLARG